MIKKIASVGIYVKDQSEALRFYTEALGFEIRTDMTMGDFRWLTIGLKDQPDFEYVLMPLKAGGPLDEAGVQAMTALLEAGKLSGGVLKTDDIYRTYDELKAKGVEFLMPPTDQPYGIIETIIKDNSGNWFSLSQDK